VQLSIFGCLPASFTVISLILFDLLRESENAGCLKRQYSGYLGQVKLPQSPLLWAA